MCILYGVMELPRSSVTGPGGFAIIILQKIQKVFGCTSLLFRHVSTKSLLWPFVCHPGWKEVNPKQKEICCWENKELTNIEKTDKIKSGRIIPLEYTNSFERSRKEVICLERHVQIVHTQSNMCTVSLQLRGLTRLTDA